MPQSDLVQKRIGQTLELRINRPKQRNSLTADMVGEITDLFTAANLQEDIRAIVLRGNGGFFCSGADLGQLDLSATAAAGRAAVEMSEKFAKMCVAISDCSAPVITIVEGPAIGGGFGVACSSDICLANPSATFGFGAQRIGAVPGPIVPFVLDRAGFSTTKLLAVTGSMLSAENALSKGVVHDMGDDVDTLVVQHLDAILECGPRAARKTKQMVIDANRENRDDLIKRACQMFGEIVISDEAVEGFKAFREKRIPSWRG